MLAHLPGHAPAIPLALIFASVSSSAFGDGNSHFVWETNGAPFRISLFSYGTDGKFHDASQYLRENINSLSYDGPVTNLIFNSTLPPAPTFEKGHFNMAVPDPRAEISPTNRAPPRPVASQYQIDQWTSQDGLPGNKINALLQTHNGYLWIGTVAGLVRFDGVRFTVFDENNSPEMASAGSNVRALFEDDQHRLWIGTREGCERRRESGVKPPD